MEGDAHNAEQQAVVNIVLLVHSYTPCCLAGSARPGELAI